MIKDSGTQNIEKYNFVVLYNKVNKNIFDVVCVDKSNVDSYNLTMLAHSMDVIIDDKNIKYPTYEKDVGDIHNNLIKLLVLYFFNKKIYDLLLFNSDKYVNRINLETYISLMRTDEYNRAMVCNIIDME
jgi:hypothetical protein